MDSANTTPDDPSVQPDAIESLAAARNASRKIENAFSEQFAVVQDRVTEMWSFHKEIRHNVDPKAELGDRMVGGSNGETDAKIAAAEARTDTKIVRLEGKLDLVLAKLDTVGTEYRSVRANIWAVGAVVIAAVALIATVAIGVAPAAFQLGTQLRDTIRQEIETQKPKPTP